MQEVADVLAEELLDRHAEAPLERRVGEEDGPRVVGDDGDVRRQLEDPRGGQPPKLGRVGAL
jgi:hypothetical protein